MSPLSAMLIAASIFVSCRAGIGEAWAAVKKGATWSNVWQAKTDADSARYSARHRFPGPGLHNGVGDAYS